MNAAPIFHEAGQVLHEWLQSLSDESRRNLHKHLAAGSSIALELILNPAPFDRSQKLSVVLVDADGKRQTLSSGLFDDELH